MEMKVSCGPVMAITVVVSQDTQYSSFGGDGVSTYVFTTKAGFTNPEFSFPSGWQSTITTPVTMWEKGDSTHTQNIMRRLKLCCHKPMYDIG